MSQGHHVPRPCPSCRCILSSVTVFKGSRERQGRLGLEDASYPASCANLAATARTLGPWAPCSPEGARAAARALERTGGPIPQTGQPILVPKGSTGKWVDSTPLCPAWPGLGSSCPRLQRPLPGRETLRPHALFASRLMSAYPCHKSSPTHTEEEQACFPGSPGLSQLCQQGPLTAPGGQGVTPTCRSWNMPDPGQSPL